MTRDNLPNKPLLEAVWEIQWDPKQSRKNPFFSIFWGKLHVLLNERFPEIESLLPDIPFPEEVLQTMFHYRFYSKGKTLPIVQLGPGALSLHDADSYGWDSFKEKIAFVVESFFQSQPKSGNFSPHRLALKYVNFYECDFLKENIFDFLRNNLKVTIQLPAELFSGGRVVNQPSPYNFINQFFFPCLSSSGVELGEAGLSIKAGEKNGKRGLFMETIIQYPQVKGPKRQPDAFSTWKNHEGIVHWAEEAHLIAKSWFFSLIEGPLEEKFEQ